MLAMKSGAAFSAIFLIWITGFVLAFYTMYPDIEKSIKIAESINFNDTRQLIKEDGQDISAISYSPLGIFDLVKN